MLNKKYDLGVLTNEDWRMFEILYLFLKEYYKYNLLLESDFKPTIHYTTEAYTSLYSHNMYWVGVLDWTESNNKIIGGIIKSSNILTKYFNLGTIVHFAANIFDPRAKLFIYENNHWNVQAREMVNEYNTNINISLIEYYYKLYDKEQVEERAQKRTRTKTVDNPIKNITVNHPIRPYSRFGEIVQQDPITYYLKCARVPDSETFDIIKF